MIDEQRFNKVEVVQLIQDLSGSMNENSFGDCVSALAVVLAFCIDSSPDKKRAKAEVYEIVDWILERASSVGAMDKVNEIFRHDQEELHWKNPKA